MNKLDDKLMDSDPQKFADELGEAGTQALQTSKFLEGKADATENPVTVKNSSFNFQFLFHFFFFISFFIATKFERSSKEN